MSSDEFVTKREFEAYKRENQKVLNQAGKSIEALEKKVRALEGPTLKPKAASPKGRVALKAKPQA